MTQKKVDSIVEVTASFWRADTEVEIHEINGEAIWGPSWPHKEWDDFTAPASLAVDGNQYDDYDTVKFTKDAVSLSFNWMTATGGECGLQYEIENDGIVWTFQQDYDYLVNIATAKLSGMKSNDNVVKFLTAWHYWTSRSYDGEYDAGLELLGVIDVNHLHFEGEPDVRKTRAKPGRCARRVRK